ncbi:MAG: Na+/H+ antiporter NhaA [Phenylobacterium sp.]|uniref:Na+/H+ antiporter NhaA n=1 Tax=Phenylobacterium sp. TaxID=1871053 RepID=UPI0025D81B4F|nr:Na+/H+ antiporter NhaA [Phenylobacterium sp.]MCA6223455.1 Na+/H+ antiporter NhaA [Phenylobacterium sp.]MCA6227143.1 Na+/H+ antiporter NhaA [Phenylobacterium sp.]MCA6233173.1 Na+/H+ antiporter NhaA [Phenylobacterium sp.]MCA6248538.1 Na+/H+ antiporter NhaA [Phenylobacterium sp.]MCA6253155.1 Na+/H+ antiporter NhaA [Phenylobacterium sp.]
MSRKITLDFLKTEAASGTALALAAALAIFLANSPWATSYFSVIKHPLTFQVGDFEITKPVLKWIKDGLMTIFFFVVGLEIKYEILRGELSNPRKLALPVLGALGGMVVPAVVYLAFNMGPGGAVEGWPAPVATDIAFALAALAIAGPRLPLSLRTFLLTLAIADDLGAVVLIATLFTERIDLVALAGAGVVLALMALAGRWRGAPYALFGVLAFLVWAFTLESGVNPSIAGVAAAMTIPIEPRRPGESGMLKQMMHALHPYVAYGVMPIFAFAAAGFSFGDLSADNLLSPVAIGIAAGLFIGKQIGVFGASVLAIRLGIARRPSDSTWVEIYGCALLCGVGFTMSLFIGALAFDAENPTAQSAVRLGVIGGSLLSAAVGMAVLAWRQRQRDQLAATEAGAQG